MTGNKPHGSIREVVVVGAGIGGLAAAVLAARAGFQVEVIEAQPHPGGLLAPIEFGALPCDRGSHRVHPDAHPLLRELTKDAGWVLRPRNGRLVFGGRLLPYPPTPARFLQGLGFSAAAHMALGWLTRPGALRRTLSWESSRADSREDKGFQAFVKSRVGEPAYELFYRPYAVKVWGGEPSQLSQSVAKQRVSTSNPLPTLLGLTRHEFLYPVDGMVSLIQSLRRKAERLGVRFKFSTRYTPEDADTRPVLFSGNLGALVPEIGLEHRGLYLLYLEVSSNGIADVDTWYAPEAQFWFGRVSQPARFSAAFERRDSTVLCIEIPEGDWGSQVDFLDSLPTLMTQLIDAGILNETSEIISAEQHFLPRVYPMYSRGWIHRWRAAIDTVAKRGQVFPFARQGLFLHCNMDHCVHIASELVEHLKAGGDSREWAKHCRRYLSVRVRD